MDITIFMPELIDVVVTSATGLLGALGTVFADVVELIYNEPNFTELGTILVATAGFALGWAGIRFIFNLVNRLLNKSRAGR